MARGWTLDVLAPAPGARAGSRGLGARRPTPARPHWTGDGSGVLSRSAQIDFHATIGCTARFGVVVGDWLVLAHALCRQALRRDAAVALVRDAAAAGREIRGFEVDRACRNVLDQAGFGPQFVHRTGHSLGTEVHGNGVHMDDFETKDERKLIPGTGFTIEPGVYTKAFGVRTEINMFVGARDATVTGPLQTEFVLL